MNQAIARPVPAARLAVDEESGTDSVKPDRLLGIGLCLYLIPVLLLVLAIGCMFVMITRIGMIARMLKIWPGAACQTGQLIERE